MIRAYRINASSSCLTQTHQKSFKHTEKVLYAYFPPFIYKDVTNVPAMFPRGCE